MNFKDMTKSDIKRFTKIYKDKDLSWDKRMEKLMKLTGKSERTVRKWASEKLNLSEKKESIPEEYIKAQKRIFNKKKKKFIVTWAQNNTPVNERFFKNLIKYSKHIDADIHVIAGRYKNPTSVWSDEQEEDERWDEMVQPFLDANRHDIHKYVSIMSDIKIHPTAVNPMTGMQSISGVNSCIFGSPKLQMEMIPVIEGEKSKMMVTTGACTEKNYTDSKAGKKGEFHHVIGFVVVEIEDDETFYIRQVSAEDNGDFLDLYKEVAYDVKSSKTIIKDIKDIEACILGDLHWGHHEQEVLDVTHKMLNKIKPKHVVLHDVFDGYSISHHDMKDPFVQYSKEINDKNNLKKEVDELLEGLETFEKYENVVIVRSNHDDFLDRWVKNEDWKRQPTPKNSPLYMEYSSILLKQYAEHPENVKGIIPSIINNKFPNFKTLGRRDSYKVLDWELGQHGDVGSNGSRGSLLQYRKLNTKIIVGHYHSPQRKDGALAVGTSTKLRVGYNNGPSSWLQSHVIIHKNGKAQHINFFKNKNGEINYTTFK